MRLFMAALSATIILLSGCASTTFDTVEAPEWKSGYAFTYVTKGSVSAHMDGSGEEPFDFDDDFGPFTSSFEVISTEADPAFYIAATKSESTGMLAQPPALAIEKANLTFLPAMVEGSSVTWKASPVTLLKFPLSAGKSWSYTMPSVPDGVEDGLGIGQLSVKAEATKSMTVTVGNESIEVIEVVHRMSAPDLQNMVNEARQQMKDEGIDGSISASFSGRETILYAPALEAIVRDTVQVGMTISFSVSYQGETASGTVESSSLFETQLIGIDRVPEADRSMEEAAAFIASGQPIETPGGVELPGDAFPLVINQSAKEVNAADKPTVTFSVELPDDATAQWRIFDAAGVSVLDGEGASLEFNVEKPGSYGIEAMGRDAEGRLAATATTMLIADYEGTVSITCMPAAVTPPFGPSPLSCTAANLEVPVGLRSFSLSLDAGTAAPVAPGQFRVSDGSGNVQANTQNGMATIDSGDLAPGTWSLQWRPTVGVAHSPTVEVTLDYGAPTMTAEAAAMDALRAMDLPFELPF